LLDRYGIITREVVNADGLTNFSDLYPVYKALEDAGKIRRGYFVAGLGGAQFARPGADERLRAKPDADDTAVVLAATDPANPYGAALPWPETEARLQRSVGALVVLHAGRLVAYLGRSDRALITFLPELEPERGHSVQALAGALHALVGLGKRRYLMLATIDDMEARNSPLAPALLSAGFTPSASGLVARRGNEPVPEVEDEDDLEQDA
jgi:ATP-dependent Lhr-like helicase